MTRAFRGSARGVCLRPFEGEAFAKAVVTLAGFCGQAVAIEDGDLAASTRDQSSTLEFAERIGHRGPLNAQHIGKHCLGDRERVAVALRSRVVRSQRASLWSSLCAALHAPDTSA